MLFCSASDEVKKVFSLHYVTFFKIYQCYEKEMVEKVRRHPYDNSSVEVQSMYQLNLLLFLIIILNRELLLLYIYIIYNNN